MALRRTAFLLARMFFCLFVLLTSFYCLLSFIPFSYHWFIKFSPVAWLPKFALYHPYIWLVAALVVWPTLKESFYNVRTRRLAITFVLANLVTAAVLLFHPFLLDVPNDYRAFIWSLLALFPIAWLAMLDLATASEGTPEAEEPAAYSPIPATLASAFVCLAYTSTTIVRFGAVSPFAIAINAASLLVVLTAAFVFFESSRLAALRVLPQNLSATAVALSALGFVAAAVLIRKLVLATLGFNNSWANVYAIALSLTVILALCGLVIQSRAYDQPKSSATSHSVVFYIAALLTLIAFIVFAPVLIGKNDWNFLLKKMVAVITWSASLLLFYRIFSRPARSVNLARHIVALATLAAAVFAGYKLLALPVSDAHADALELYAGYDTSFKLARDILTPALDDESYLAFYEFLQRNTTLPESVQVQPVPIRLVEDLQPARTPRPHIFYFIVDSLRQDYLSPYNKNVTFTPNFDAFGRESVVFQNAFTRYGGTVLSVPALWTGSMQLHKQYIQPFYPMAELQKLIDADRYQKWITMDPVIKLLMHDDPQIYELDRNASYWTEYDLNRTMKEVEARIDARGANEPLFVYSQAHNTHTATLSLLSKKRPPTKDYPGFNNQFASEVERMDSGFGEFIAFLKQRGLYDNSIVIVTSDHGDSLGEFGRWGHGSTLFPEVVKVPLIVHLPKSMQSLYSDPQAVAFSLDITPSLFYLLGHRPIRNDELLGRPLFTETKAEHDAYVRDAYLLVSSYGPVYARLSERGTRLFIVDAAAHQNYLYDLATDPTGIHNRLALRDFPENERFIRQHVEDIARFYHYDHGLQSAEKK